MQLLYVPLRQETLAILAQLARDERRRPQDQAAYLLERALRPAIEGNKAAHEGSESQ